MLTLHRAALPVAAVAIALFASGCFDDSTTAPSTDSANDTIQLSRGPEGDGSGSDHARGHGPRRTYRVTLENLTPATGMGSSQPF